ncbi:MAG: GIY-YIG nuclease family protein [Bacteroidetes bacterium]|nr:GIY-YIG nuclease family protein [Bacteroidota bacterium]
MYFVYILYSKTHDRFYVGHTSSIERRLIEHNEARNPSTKPYIPWELVGTIIKDDKASAYQLEMKLAFINKHCN